MLQRQPTAHPARLHPAHTVGEGGPAAERLTAQDLWAVLQPPNTHTLTPGGPRAHTASHRQPLQPPDPLELRWTCLAFACQRRSGGTRSPSFYLRSAWNFCAVLA